MDLLETKKPTYPFWIYSALYLSEMCLPGETGHGNSICKALHYSERSLFIFSLISSFSMYLSLLNLREVKKIKEYPFLSHLQLSRRAQKFYLKVFWSETSFYWLICRHLYLTWLLDTYQARLFTYDLPDSSRTAISFLLCSYYLFPQASSINCNT